MVRDVSKDYSGIAILENLNLEMFIAITHDVTMYFSAFRRGSLCLKKDDFFLLLFFVILGLKYCHYFEGGNSLGSSFGCP